MGFLAALTRVATRKKKIVTLPYYRNTSWHQSQWPAVSSPRPLCSQQSVKSSPAQWNTVWVQSCESPLCSHIFLAALADGHSSSSNWVISPSGRAGQSCRCHWASVEVVRRLCSPHTPLIPRHSLKDYYQCTFTCQTTNVSEILLSFLG